MGFAKLVLPDKNIRYRNNTNYKNIGSISKLINYILAEGKTYITEGEVREKVRYCDSNCVDIFKPYKGVQQIKAVKKFFKKTDGRQMYHYILSFSDEIKEAKEVYKVGWDIMNKFFNEHQTVFAVHEDTDNLHIHFVFNSVSYLTGKKWCLNYKEWYQFKHEVECRADSHFCKIISLLE